MNNGLIIIEEISPEEEIVDESIPVEEIDVSELNIIEAGKFELNSLDFVPTSGELIYSDNTAKFSGEFKYTTVREPEEILTATGSISFKIHGYDGIVIDADEENDLVEVHLDGDVIKYLEDSNIKINTLRVDYEKLRDLVKTIPFATAFNSIESLVTALNGATNDEYNVGSNLFVRTLNVPDFWVSSREETSVPYTYTTDEDFVNAITSGDGSVQVGYYKVSILETEKVDLSGYYTKTESDAITDELQRDILKVDGILAETNYDLNQAIADIESLEMGNKDLNDYVTDLQTRVGDIEEFGLTTNTPQIIKKEGAKIFESSFGISSNNGANVVKISNYGNAISFLDADGSSMFYLDKSKQSASAFGKELMTKEDFVAQHGTKVFVNNEFQETFNADTKADKTVVDGIVKSLDSYVLKTKTVDDNTATIMNNGNTVSVGVQDLDGGSILGLSSNSVQLSISENEDESHILMTPDHIDIDGKALTHNGENILVESDLNDYATKEYVNVNGGKIDTISVNGTKQTIDENKNVDLKVVETEIDPTVPAHVKAITEEDITSWNDKAEIADLPTNYVTTDTTQTINASKTIVGDLTIQGNITQNGSDYITHAEKVYTTNDYITMREGATGGLGDGYSGFQVKLYNGVDDGRLVIDSNGIARVGDVGDEQPLATREEVPLDGGFAKWDGANKKFVTNTISSSDLTDKNSLATASELDTVKSNVDKNASDISTIQNDISDIDQDIINTNAKFNDYLPLTGGIVTGNIISTGDITAQSATLGAGKLMGNLTSQEEDYVIVADAQGNMKKRAMNKVLDDIGGSTILDEGIRVSSADISDFVKKEVTITKEDGSTYPSKILQNEGTAIVNGDFNTETSELAGNSATIINSTDTVAAIQVLTKENGNLVPSQISVHSDGDVVLQAKGETGIHVNGSNKTVNVISENFTLNDKKILTETDISQLEADINALEINVNQATADISQLETGVSVLESDINQVETQVSNINNKTNELQTEVNKRLKIYLNLTEVNASFTKTTPIPDIIAAMEEGSYLQADISELGGDTSVYPATDGILEIFKRRYNRNHCVYTRKVYNGTVLKQWVGSMAGGTTSSLRWSGWKEVVLNGSDPSFGENIDLVSPNDKSINFYDANGNKTGQIRAAAGSKSTVYNGGGHYFRNMSNTANGVVVAPGTAMHGEVNNQIDLGTSTKRFKNLYTGSWNANSTSRIKFDMTKGSKPTTKKYREILFQDNAGDAQANNFGMIGSSVDTAGIVDTYIRAYTNVSGSTAVGTMIIRAKEDGTFSYQAGGHDILTTASPPVVKELASGTNINDLIGDNYLGTYFSKKAESSDYTLQGDFPSGARVAGTGKIWPFELKVGKISSSIYYQYMTSYTRKQFIRYALQASSSTSILPWQEILTSNGGTIDGGVTIKGYESNLFAEKQSDTPANVIYISTPSYNIIYPQSGVREYFQELLEWICENYPNIENGLFIGQAAPNSIGSFQVQIYNTSTIRNGLPQYSSGMYVGLSGVFSLFGTNEFTYNYREI